MKFKLIQIVLILAALCGICIFAPIVNAETGVEWDLTNKGVDYIDVGEYEKAIEYFDKAIELNPNYPTAFYSRGIAYMNLGQYERAIEEFNEAITHDPNYVVAYYNRGVAYAFLNQYERAIEDYNKALELNPNYETLDPIYEAYYNRGVAYAFLKQYERAIEDFNKAIELNPNYAIAYYSRGIAYMNLSQYERAIEDHNKAITLDPNYEAYYNRGVAYAFLNQYARAIEDYNKAIALNPNNAEAYNNRGVAYAFLNQYERAIGDYNKAIALDPNFAMAYDNREIARSKLEEQTFFPLYLIIFLVFSLAIGIFIIYRKRKSPYVGPKQTLERLENELDSMDSQGFKTEVEAIRSKLKRPDKIPEIEKGIEELIEKKPEMIPDLSVNRSTSEISITEGEELVVTIELKNDGNDVAKSVSLSDRIPNGFEIISGDNSWTGNIKQSESKSIEYKIKADKAGKYTIPSLTVEYEDKRGKLYEKSTKAIEIEVIHELPPIPKNAYGVVIGIGKYEDKNIPTLKYAKEDALEIYNILTDPKYGNFPKENVRLLLDEQATLTEIRSAMGTFLARKAGKDDMVCIYFAGHGSPEIDPTGNADDKLEKFIVPYNAKKDDLFGYGLSMDTVRKILDERIKSKRAVFFIDSCYSGEAGGRTFSRSDVATRNITISEKFLEQLSGEGRIIITASKPDELSLETDELRHGIFTYYLAEGLKGKADLNKDGFVTVDELYSYVYEQVTKKARQLGVGQHPLKKGTIVGKIPLTRYETEEMMHIKELNLNASRLFEEEKYEEALVIWSEVLKIDEGNAEALAGIKKSKKKIEEAEAILTEKQRRLLELHKRGLPAKEYDEAMILLKKNPPTYTELERNIVEYIEKLLNGDISIGVYVDTLKLIK